MIAFRGNDERISVLHQEEGGIGKSIPDAQDFPRPKRFPEGEARGKSRGSREISRDFPRPWVLHHETRGISRGRSPREIPRVEGCKTHGQGKSRGRRGWISQYLPSLGGARTFSHNYQGRIDWQLHTSYCALISPSSGSFLIQAGTLTMLLYKWYCVLFQNSTFMI